MSCLLRLCVVFFLPLFYSGRRLTLDWSREIQSGRSSIPKTRQKGDALQMYHPGYIQIERPLEKFRTGSSYEGKCDALGFAGLGVYTYPHGAVYEGYFRDGQFHGDGTIKYPMGQELDGTWVNGKLVNYTFRSADGLEYDHPWIYCKFPDRTFKIERQHGFKPPGKERLTNNFSRNPLPDFTYDTADGYYQHSTQLVFNDQHRSLRICSPLEEKRIEQNYRQVVDKPVGYRKDLYEYWTTGRYEETMELLDVIEESDRVRKSAEELNNSLISL